MISPKLLRTAPQNPNLLRISIKWVDYDSIDYSLFTYTEKRQNNKFVEIKLQL